MDNYLEDHGYKLDIKIAHDFIEENLVLDADTKNFIKNTIFMNNSSLKRILFFIKDIKSSLDDISKYIENLHSEFPNDLRYKYLNNLVNTFSTIYKEDYDVYSLKQLTRQFMNFAVEFALAELRAQVKIFSDEIDNAVKALIKLRQDIKYNKESIYTCDKSLDKYRKLHKFCKVLLYPFDKGILKSSDVDLNYFINGRIYAYEHY